MQSEGVILRVNSTFNTTELEFSSPTVTSTGAIMIPFSFQGHPLYLQTPIVSCPVGFRVFTSNNGTHKLLINPTSEMNSMIQRIDDFVIDTILSRSQEWFNKNFVSRDIVQALFYNSLKQNKTYPISMNVRLKFNNDNGLPLFTLFDSSRDEIVFTEGEGVEKMLDILKGKCRVRLILANTSVWSVSGRYGYGWDVVQMQLCSDTTINTKTCLFQDDDDDSVCFV